MVQKITRVSAKQYPRYVTVTQGMVGFFAVLVEWNSDGFWEPYSTGDGRYRDPKKAAAEAQAWAEAEGLPLYDPFNLVDNTTPEVVQPELKPGGTQEFIDQILAQAEKEKAERVAKYPDISNVLEVLAECRNRLRDEGWRLIEEPYWPKDENILTICIGCKRPMETFVTGEHPNFGFMVADGNDWYPARPIMWKPLIKEVQPSKKTL